MEQAEGLTKQDVMALVKELEEKPAQTVLNHSSVSDRLFARLKAVRKKKALLESAEARKRLDKIEALLKEIEELG